MKTSACFLLAGSLAVAALHAAGEQRPGPPGGDPFVRGNDPVEAAPPQEPRVMSICFETFSLDIAEAAAMYRKMTTDAKFYEEILERVSKGKAKQESFTVLRARSGEKATTENISEYIYPTEYETALTFNQFSLNTAAEVPSPVPVPPAGDFAAPHKYIAPPRPSSFETRNTGLTLEVEPTMGGNAPIVDLRIAPDIVTLVDRAKWGQGISEAEMPIFESQRTSTASTVKLGLPHLISTLNRPPVSKVDADSASRIWFAFVTIDLVAY
jgi:hypothetical protein